MTNIAEKTLKQMYDEYLRTGDADWINISTPIGKQLKSLDYVTDNTQGDFKLTSKGISYFES